MKDNEGYYAIALFSRLAASLSLCQLLVPLYFNRTTPVNKSSHRMTGIARERKINDTNAKQEGVTRIIGDRWQTLRNVNFCQRLRLYSKIHAAPEIYPMFGIVTVAENLRVNAGEIKIGGDILAAAGDNHLGIPGLPQQGLENWLYGQQL